jgi:hypothetical protein
MMLSNMLEKLHRIKGHYGDIEVRLAVSYADDLKVILADCDHLEPMHGVDGDYYIEISGSCFETKHDS